MKGAVQTLIKMNMQITLKHFVLRIPFYVNEVHKKGQHAHEMSALLPMVMCLSDRVRLR